MIFYELPESFKSRSCVYLVILEGHDEFVKNEIPDITYAIPFLITSLIQPNDDYRTPVKYRFFTFSYDLSLVLTIDDSKRQHLLIVTRIVPSK